MKLKGRKKEQKICKKDKKLCKRQARLSEPGAAQASSGQKANSLTRGSKLPAARASKPLGNLLEQMDTHSSGLGFCPRATFCALFYSCLIGAGPYGPIYACRWNLWV